RHVVVKLYQPVELGGNGAHYSFSQARTASLRGCTVGGYGWLYAGIDGARQVADFLDTATRAGIALGANNPLWLDCEDYTDGSHPSLAVIRQAVQECARRGVACGIYSAAWWWVPRTGDSGEFSALPLWAAIYDQRPVLVDAGFGGWTTLAAKQWSGNPVDRS